MKENDAGVKPKSNNELWGKQRARNCRLGGQETRVSGERPDTVRYAADLGNASLSRSQRCRNWDLPH